MRHTEWPLQKDAFFWQGTGDAVDLGSFQRLIQMERRQNSGNPARDHCFADTGLPGQEQVVHPGRCDFCRPLCQRLPMDIREILLHSLRGLQ